MSDTPSGTGASGKQTADGSGKHRGVAASSEEKEGAARGRHRRPPQESPRQESAA
jgi:hypothetical protein